MNKIRWGIAGPGTIANKFALAVKDVESAELVALASHNTDKLVSFGKSHGVPESHQFRDYPSMMRNADDDAGYIANLHPSHATTAIAAMRAGKHVLCEKPAGMSAGEVELMTDVAKQEGVCFMEAFMYLCHPQMQRLLDVVTSGQIGQVLRVETSFGFNDKPNPDSRLFAHALGGGGILDVGCYPVSFARRIAGVVAGQELAPHGFAEPDTVVAVGNLYKTGIDLYAHALLQFPGGLTASCECAITRELPNRATVIGDKGSVSLLDPWLPGDGNKPSHGRMEICLGDDITQETIDSPNHHYSYEVAHACSCIAASSIEASLPAMNHRGSIGNAEVLDQWRNEIGYKIESEKESLNKPLQQLLPSSQNKMAFNEIDGLGQPLSKLILGCDNKSNLAQGAIIWDTWMESGANAFDTAHIYANGLHERVFGQWIRSRGVQNDIVAVVKGAHTPYCVPAAIEIQLNESLGRLHLDNASIYMMHRDNPDVPVGEFVTAINALIDAGRIGIYGFSNWSVSRFSESCEYAKANNLRPPVVLSNNCSLATMQKPVWPGCLSINNPADLAWFKDKQVAHLSWSAQARGYFSGAEHRHVLPKAIGPENCFGGKDNEERLRRAGVLAQEKNVAPSAIALAWVLALPFPSFALVGPRSAGEIASLLPALGVELSHSDVAWLNLESANR